MVQYIPVLTLTDDTDETITTDEGDEAIRFYAVSRAYLKSPEEDNMRKSSYFTRLYNERVGANNYAREAGKIHKMRPNINYL